MHFFSDSILFYFCSHLEFYSAHSSSVELCYNYFNLNTQREIAEQRRKKKEKKCQQITSLNILIFQVAAINFLSNNTRQEKRAKTNARTAKGRDDGAMAKGERSKASALESVRMKKIVEN